MANNYEELVADLRYCADDDTYCSTCKYFDANCERKLIAKAADAIEELQQTVEHYKGCADDWYKEACEYRAAVPKWISVTEQLPQEDPVGSMVLCALKKRRTGFRWIDLRLFMDGEFHHPKHQKGQVTHWMPLPEPPRVDPCADCVHYPPSSTDGKPCCACDPANPLTNCHEMREGEG